MKKFIIYLLILLASPESLLAQTTVGTGGSYSTLSDAFNAINEGDLSGVIELRIISSITETVTAVLYQNGYNGTADYTSVTVYPAGTYTIDGYIDGPLIDLNGASNVTFNGRVDQSGAIGITIINTSTGTAASTIQFTESAENNTIEYCIIKGSGTGATTGGVIFFSQSTSGSGNSNNIIDNNDITSSVAGRPVNAVYSNGTPGSENSGNIISNNNIYNFLKHGTASNGVFLSSNTTACTISGNSFYETASFAPSAAVTYDIIKIDNTSGAGFTISGNFIGGRSASCGGSAWTKTNANNNIFFAIYLNVGTGTVSSIQNNTIKNFSWSNSSSAAWTGIHIAAGAVNIGTGTANTIGASTGTGSITVTGGANGTNVYGINIASGGTVDCRNNIIGSVTAANSNSNNATNFYGINKTSTAGTTTISNNTIGSLTQINSINASSASASNAQSVFGISNAGTGNVTISSNMIANLTNGTTNSTAGTAGLINGIKSTDGTNTISNNTIRDLTNVNANTSTTNSASVCGIALTGATLKTITGNTIYNLKNTYSLFAGSVIGLFFTGNTGANLVSENFIHSLSVTGASSTSAGIYGIKTGAGAATYSNNIISLGGSTATTIYGINETGTAGENNNLYFNTVYIGGSLGTAVTNKSYALYSAVTTNTRDFRNNIFYNARSTTSGSSLHYATYIVTIGGTITCDYNDYYVTGAGGVLGYYGGDKAGLPIVTGQDANSLATDPLFANAGGTLPYDYLPSAPSLVGISGTGILIDYNGAARVIPTIGAFEIGCNDPASGGTIAADQSVCPLFDPAAFTSTGLPSGHTGTIEYKWQKKVGADPWEDIPGSNSTTYDPGPLTQTTRYKRIARVSCMPDWTGAAASNEVTVTINPLPDIGLTVGGTGSVCSGTGTNITVGLSESGVNYQLRNGVTNVGAPVAGNGGTINLPTGNLIATTTFNALATNAVTGCSAQLTQTATVTVNPLPNKNLVVGGTGSICTGTSTNITVAFSETGTNYQLRNDNANEPVGTPVAGNGGTINLPTGNMTYNIQYNVLATNTITGCSAQLTEKEIVSIDPLSVGGSVSGSSPITYGSSTGNMTLTGHTGVIQRWEKRFNSGSWTIVSNTNATYSEIPSSAGTWDYRAVVKSGTCSEANSAEFSITVIKAALTITADNKNKDYGAPLPTLTVTYSGLVNGDPAPATLPAVTTTATASSPAGNYPITASGASDPNYNISYVAGILTVDKVSLTITADNKSKDYGAPLPTLTVTYSGLVNGDTAPATPPAIITTATAASPAGTYPVTASGAVDPNYNISYTAGTLTVDKVSLIITPDNKSKDYGASLPVLTVSYTGLVNGDTAPATLPSISTTATPASPAGTYPITASGAADPNYNISYVAGNLTVDKVGLIITPDNKSKNYGASLPVLTVSYTGLVNGDSAPGTLPTISTAATLSSPAGTYAITGSGAADPNYNITYVAGTLTVDKVPLTITADDKTKFYGDPLPVLTVSYTGLVNADLAPATPPIISTTATPSSPLGTYPITATGAADPNYIITYVAGTLYNVNAILTITADNKSKIYGAGIPVLTVSYEGLIGGDVAPATPPVISTTGTSSSPTGIYTITATGAADPKYFIIYVQGTLTVNRAPLTITADNKTKNYGEALPVLTLTYTGLVNGDTETTTPPSLSTSATSSSSAGSYAITASGASDANYDLTYTDGTMSVEKAVLQVTADNKSKNYGDVNPVLSLSYSGFAGTEDKNVINAEPVLTTTALQYSNTGTYPITASGGSDDNYAFSYNDGVLTINKINLIFTADNKTRDYYTANPDLTYTVTGFVNSETQSVLDLLPAISTTAIQSSSVDSYPITLSGGNDNNYSFIYVPGQMTITQATQVITFTSRPEKLLLKDAYPLAATSTSGLTVLFESLNPELATVSGNTLTAVANGNAMVKAYNPGDQNYYPAEVTVTVEIYSTHKNILYLFTPNNDGINDYWELPDLDSWGNCNVKVYSRWGQLVFSEKDYNNLWDGTSNGDPLPEGPYYFIIDTENAGAIKGTVNLVR